MFLSSFEPFLSPYDLFRNKIAAR